MAPRQLRLELNEADTAADKGAKRVRVESTDESSSQVQLRARAIAWDTSRLCPAHCLLGLTTSQSFGSEHGNFGYPLQHPLGVSKFRLEKNSASAWRAATWRPDSSCWSWRMSTWPRRKARKESALIAQMILQCRYDCQPERPPAPPA
eukprot:scaffold9334_cov122-Isochrysis_galbana.AAC.5